jgi:O-antigen ligase
MIMPNRGGQITAAFLTRAGQMTHLAEYSEGTAGERLDLWTLLLKDVRKNPFVGHGVDAYQKYYPDKTYTTENFFIEVLHATGVWGFVPLIGVIIAITWRAWRLSLDRVTDLQDRSITLGMLAGYIAVLAGSLTNSLWGGGLFWAMLGVLAGTVDIVALNTRTLREMRLMENRRLRLSEELVTA